MPGNVKVPAVALVPVHRRSHLALAFCAAAVAVAGCPEPGYYIDVSFDGNMTASADGFEMDGAIVVGGGAAKLDAYRNVTVSLYAENGTLLYAETVGTIEVRQPYSLTVPFVPHYVVIDSPDFWREPDPEVDYYVRVEDLHYDYDQEPAGSRDELPPNGEE